MSRAGILAEAGQRLADYPRKHTTTTNHSANFHPSAWPASESTAPAVPSGPPQSPHTTIQRLIPKVRPQILVETHMCDFDLGVRVVAETDRALADMTYLKGVDHDAIQFALSRHKVALLF